MRRTMKHNIAILIALAIVAVIAFQALQNEPPAPYVRVDDFRVSPTYIIRIECVDGFELQTYAREGEGELPHVLTNRPCETSAHRP